jgi:hypothetical protein
MVFLRFLGLVGSISDPQSETRKIEPKELTNSEKFLDRLKNLSLALRKVAMIRARHSAVTLLKEVT